MNMRYHATLPKFTHTKERQAEEWPPHTPIGGAHPTSFAGHGVALGLMDGVCLGDPKTWIETNADEKIFSFERARDLAATFDPDTSPIP
jgi:hypothetical protein